MQTTCERLARQIDEIHREMFARMATPARNRPAEQRATDLAHMLLYMNDRVRLLARTSRDPRRDLLNLLNEMNQLSINLTGVSLNEQR